MANTKSAIKAARKTETLTLRNKGIKSRLKTLAKKFQKVAAEGKADATKAVASEYASALDRAAKNNIISKNAASRKKSQLSKWVFAK